MKKIFLTLVLLQTFLIFSQNIRVEGTIVVDDFPSRLGQSVIYSLPDSSLVKGTYLDSNYFSILFKSSFEKEYYLQIKIPGFDDKTINFTTNDTLVSLGLIPLVKNEVLEEVDIVFQKQMFERTMDGIVVNVEGTSLQNLTSLFDVLKASPRLTSPDDERIEIIGKGSPLILVDKQAIISNEELKAIPANQIEKIEIITNPSAKYRAQGSGGGVIEVYTKKFHLEGYSASISTDAGVNTQIKPTSRSTIGINVKRKKISINGYMGGNYNSNIRVNDETGFTTDGSNRSLESSNISEAIDFWRYYNIKTAYTINKNQKITLGLNGSGSTSKNHNVSSANYFNNNILETTQELTSDPRNTWLNNTAFLNYTLETDTNRSTFEINLNYTNKLSGGNGIYTSQFENISTNSFSQFSVKNEHNDRPNIGEIRVNYEHIFDTTKWKLNVGGAYSVLLNGKSFNQSKLFGNEWIIDPVYSNSYDYEEQIGALFTEISKNWKKIGFRVGVRGEYTYLNGYSNSLNTEFIDSSYIKLFPTASILLEPNEKIGITFSYSSGINRPQFSNFDPFVRIEDSLNISYGNPYLRPALVETFGLEFDILYQYNIALSYSRTKSPMSQISFVDQNSYIIETTPWNAQMEENFSMSFSLPIQTKWLQGWNSAWLNYGKYSFTEEFNRIPFFNLTYGFYSHLNFTLPKDFSIMNRTYLYKWGNDGFTANTIVSWGLRLTKKYKGNNFQLYVDVANIIPQINRFEQFSGNYQGTSVTQFNFTTFKVGLYYKFGRLKSADYIKESSSKQSDRI